ncbi:hypothetical protein BDN72DRAFT_839452 [Pluteus cervinus]|uniref:Uncharacterized protein n=1 Tax=Pluteus cervinus TaxID=181527 RepID=A0ACD3AXR0_9AGAR|nr:hypothetical protein BDN72DRAFT_839452 [Pluteus cervinus]
MSTSTPAVPTELILEILLWVDIDFIGVDRSTALFSCCLVSRSWLAAAQPLLFSRITVKIGTAGKQKLATRILSYPDKLRAYILQLRLDVRAYGSGDPVQDVAALANTSGDWQFRGLRLENSFHLLVSQTFQTLPSSDRLTSLSLRRLTVSSDVLLSLPPALREIQLDDVHVDDLQLLISDTRSDSSTNPEQSTPSPRPSIQKLSLTNGGGLVTWFYQPHCHLDFSHLETLLLCEETFVWEYFEDVGLFLAIVGPTIKHLFFGLTPHLLDLFSIPSHLPLGNMKRIRSLSLRLGTYDDKFGWIMGFLQNLPDGQLEEICIYTVPLCKRLAHAPGWGVLDDELTLRGTRVYVCLPASTSTHTQEKDKVLLAIIFQLAPTLYNQGRLTIVPSFGPLIMKDDLNAPSSPLGPTHIHPNSSNDKVHQALWRYALDF